MTIALLDADCASNFPALPRLARGRLRAFTIGRHCKSALQHPPRSIVRQPIAAM